MYRHKIRSSGLDSFRVQVEQTDLFIRAERDLSIEALELVILGRKRITDWAENHPFFLTSLKPLPEDPLAPSPVKEMQHAGRIAGVGPMAAVAGGLAEFVGLGLLRLSPKGVIVENGGDIFISAASEIVVGLFAGDASVSLSLGLVVSPDENPSGICTSSSTVGHSLSLGKTDAATVKADSAALADAVATALGNRVKRIQDIEPALNWAVSLAGVHGAAVVLGDKIGLLGDLNLVQI
ncbi:MAG: UPF0280 family protein [Deltaproteobacteria bacterium]|nr:UPF0280 family protein [Deltaproteobacteria bacterium]MBW2053303.1 UPF0280 family protein [Deltaproteobacteria bacterium]MBW2139697.1 UPF0280 family protein [Deltaproteobacteria bacterium]